MYKIAKVCTKKQYRAYYRIVQVSNYCAKIKFVGNLICVNWHANASIDRHSRCEVMVSRLSMQASNRLVQVRLLQNLHQILDHPQSCFSLKNCIGIFVYLASTVSHVAY